MKTALRLECPACGSEDVYVTEYDFGRSPETGYSDAGERGHCRTCGDNSDIEDYEIKGGSK